MKHNTAGQQATITGIVTAADWDEEDNISAVIIATPDEEEYLVDNNSKGEELLEFIHRNVRATGTIRDEGDRCKIILIKSYEVVDD
ncbi:MAG: hypothetical protein AB1611_17990 [bacterium]